MYMFKFWCQRDHSLCKDAVKNDDTVPLMKLFIKVLTIPLKSLDRSLSISALDNENLSKNSCLTSPFSCGSTWRRRRRREKEVHLPGEAPFQPLIGMLLISVMWDIFRLYLAAPPGLRPQKSASGTPARFSATNRQRNFEFPALSSSSVDDVGRLFRRQRRRHRSLNIFRRGCAPVLFFR